MDDYSLSSVISEGLGEVRDDAIYYQKLENALARLDDMESKTTGLRLSPC